MDLDLGKVTGSSIHSVTGAPAAALGIADDWAMDTTTGDVYKKGTSGWAKQGNFKGPKGDTGATGADGKTPTLSINDAGHLIATYE